MHTSILLVAGALGSALATGSGYTATVIESHTVTITNCPAETCHHTITSTVPVGVSVSETPCDTPVGSTLVTSVQTPTVPVTLIVGETPVATPATSLPAVSSTSAAPSSVVPTEVASTTEILSLSSVASTPVASTPVATVVPTSEVVPTGPIFPNSTLSHTGPFTSGILTDTAAPSTVKSTSTVHLTVPATTHTTTPTTGSAPSSSSTATGQAGRMVIPGMMMGLLALGAVLFA